jgi:hypothetical protein
MGQDIGIEGRGRREQLAGLSKISGLDLLHIVPYPLGGDDRITSIRRAMTALAPR